jgi:SNF2 family DNA or RNA helicase
MISKSSVKILHNPYAKNKRPRALDSAEIRNQEGCTNTAIMPKQACGIEHPSSSNGHSKPHSVASIPQHIQACQPPVSKKDEIKLSVEKQRAPILINEVHQSDLSFDDGGIDWTAAIQQFDQVIRGPTSSTNNDSKSLETLSKQKSSIQMKLSQSKTFENTMNQKNILTLERPCEWTNSSVKEQLEKPVRAESSSSMTSNAMNPRILGYDRNKVKPVEDNLRATLVRNARLSEPLNNGWTLYSHQKKAILKALLMRRLILALDMGLGKTLIGCVWARAMQAAYDSLQVICICPVSLIKEWKRTAENATGLLVVEPKDVNSLESGSFVRICSWAKIPEKILPQSNPYIIICDEAHSMQSLEAARTKAVLKICKSTRCVGVLLLTGTPMKNGKPANLFPLLRAVRHPFGDSQNEYEKHFCDGRDKSFGRGRIVWDANGCSNLDQLKEHISSHLLHMTKEECLGDLPPQTRIYKHVPVSSKHQLQHNQALNELATIYAATGKLEDAGDTILSAVTRVRQIGSYAKIDATVAIVQEILQEEPAVVVFTSFAKVAKEVHRKLAESGWIGELLTGETPSQKRQGLVDNFQSGLSPVFVATFGAGGVGITLTAAHTIILLDRPWTPGDTRQAEDRVRRIGQTKPVKSIWMMAFDLDKQIDQLLEQKSSTTRAVLADGIDDANPKGANKISIFQLLKSVLSNTTTSSQPPSNTLLQYGFTQLDP